MDDIHVDNDVGDNGDDRQDAVIHVVVTSIAAVNAK